jgi:peptidoglycan/LPS O-acetylase OafA/YrhL
MQPQMKLETGTIRKPSPYRLLRDRDDIGVMSATLKPDTAEAQLVPEAAPTPGKAKHGADFNRNNLDCLRLILASIVFLFHIYALTDRPAFAWFDKFLSAHFAVKAFFVISGLLIYRSYCKSSSAKSYFDKRIKRIYPAYFTVIVVAAFALCPLSSFPPARYFGFRFLKYLCANLLFLNFLAPSLPGVFTSNSIPAVNGALWTLKIEVGFYLLVPVLHYLCARFGAKKVMATIFCLSCVWKYGFALLASLGNAPSIFTLDSSRNIYSQLEVQFPGQLAYFVAGILIMLYFDTLKLHMRGIACIVVCLFVLDHWLTRGALDVFWISGFVLIFGFWRYFGNFSKYGDFSYGVYIAHFPILQTLIALGIAASNPPLFVLESLFLVGAAAILMWYLVERRFLRSSSHYRQGDLKAPA